MTGGGGGGRRTTEGKLLEVLNHTLFLQFEQPVDLVEEVVDVLAGWLPASTSQNQVSEKKPFSYTHAPQKETTD